MLKYFGCGEVSMSTFVWAKFGPGKAIVLRIYQRQSLF
jgi:hypothetical protein